MHDSQSPPDADALLADDEFLLHAGRDALQRAAAVAVTRNGRLRACLVTLTAPPVPDDPPHRSAAFSVTDVLEDFGIGVLATPSPYRGVWARTGTRREMSRWTGHSDDVNAVCVLEVDGQPLLATGSSDRTLRLWDPVTERLDRILTGHTGRLHALCTVRVDDRDLLASGSDDRTVRLWDPVTGEPLRVIGGTGRDVVLCAVRSDGRDLLASGAEDALVRLWDPGSGEPVRSMAGHAGAITALSAVRSGDREWLASTCTDKTVRLWDPATGEAGPVIAHGSDYCDAMCAVSVAGRSLVAVGGGHSVRLCDPATGRVTRTLDASPATVRAVCPLDLDGRSLLVVAESTGPYQHRIRVWDPDTGAQLRTQHER